MQGDTVRSAFTSRAGASAGRLQASSLRCHETAPIDLLTRARVQVHRVSSGLLERRIIIRAFWYLAPQILVFNMKLTHARIAPYECF
jgi:hypothetical protein